MDSSFEEQQSIESEGIGAAKMAVLDQVFQKALATSMEAAENPDLTNKHFSDNIKTKLGVNMQRILLNTLYNTEQRVQESFKEINEKHNIKEKIQLLSAAAESNSICDPSNIPEMVQAPTNEVISNVKSAEVGKLDGAIGKLNDDIKQAKEHLNRLRAQVQNELAAASEEAQKVALAAIQADNIMRVANTSNSKDQSVSLNQ